VTPEPPAPPPETPPPPTPSSGEPPPVEVPIEDALDLHAFAPRDVRSVVDEYLREAAARGFREVRLIHGRGIGIQRQAVRVLLQNHPLVAGFQDAPPGRGGWGATVVVLRPPLR
jgi:DNA-nicking Smr family endonuclease